MSDSNVKYKLVITGRGQKIPVVEPEGIVSMISFSDDGIKEEVELDVTPKQFEYIQKMAVTKSIPADILKFRKHK